MSEERNENGKRKSLASVGASGSEQYECSATAREVIRDSPDARGLPFVPGTLESRQGRGWPVLRVSIGGQSLQRTPSGPRRVSGHGARQRADRIGTVTLKSEPQRKRPAGGKREWRVLCHGVPAHEPCGCTIDHPPLFCTLHEETPPHESDVRREGRRTERSAILSSGVVTLPSPCHAIRLRWTREQQQGCNPPHVAPGLPRGATASCRSGGASTTTQGTQRRSPAFAGQSHSTRRDTPLPSPHWVGRVMPSQRTPLPRPPNRTGYFRIIRLSVLGCPSIVHEQ